MLRVKYAVLAEFTVAVQPEHRAPSR